MEASWVLLISKRVLTKSFKEMLDKIHGPSTPMSHQVLNSTHIRYQMFLRSSQVLVSPRVAHSLRYLVLGSIINLNTVLFRIASLETSSFVLTSIPLSDLFANHHQVQEQTPNLISRYPLTASIGPTPTSLSPISRSQP